MFKGVVGKFWKWFQIYFMLTNCWVSVPRNWPLEMPAPYPSLQSYILWKLRANQSHTLKVFSGNECDFDCNWDLLTSPFLNGTTLICIFPPFTLSSFFKDPAEHCITTLSSLSIILQTSLLFCFQSLWCVVASVDDLVHDFDRSLLIHRYQSGKWQMG